MISRPPIESDGPGGLVHVLRAGHPDADPITMHCSQVPPGSAWKPIPFPDPPPAPPIPLPVAQLVSHGTELYAVCSDGSWWRFTPPAGFTQMPNPVK
jgi:hypothetical protein